MNTPMNMKQSTDHKQKIEKLCTFFQCEDPAELWRSRVLGSGLFPQSRILWLTAKWNNPPTHAVNCSDDALDYMLAHPAFAKYKTLEEWCCATNSKYKKACESGHKKVPSGPLLITPEIAATFLIEKQLAEVVQGEEASQIPMNNLRARSAELYAKIKLGNVS